MRKKQAVACVIRFVSSLFDQQKRLDDQKDERKGSGIRMQTDDEKQCGEHFWQERQRKTAALPERMLTILKGKGCDAGGDDCNHGGKARGAQKRRGAGQRKERNSMNSAAGLQPEERQKEKHCGA